LIPSAIFFLLSLSKESSLASARQVSLEALLPLAAWALLWGRAAPFEKT